MQNGVVSEAVCFSEIDSMKHLKDFLGVEKADEGFLGAFLGDVKNPLSYISVLWREKAQHFGKGFQRCQALIASVWLVFALLLESIEEGQNEFRGDMLYPERCDLDAVILCRKGEKELEGIPVGFDGIRACPLDVGKVVDQELTDEGGKLHVFFFCHSAKSTSCFRLAASATRR